MVNKRSDIEIIGLEEFAQRMDLPLKDVKRAIKTGQLRPGRHFFWVVKGENPRFHWGPELITMLHEDSVQLSPAEMAIEVRRPSVNPVKPSRLNGDYFPRHAR